MLGTAPWLVVAGLVEGFVTPVGHRARRPCWSSASASASLYWGLVLWRGGARSPAADAHRRARALSRRYARTHASPSSGGRRFDHRRARGAAAARRRARAPSSTSSATAAAYTSRGVAGARRERARRDRDRAPTRHDRVAAGEHGHRVEQRARRGLVDEVGEHEDQRALARRRRRGTRGRGRCRRASARRRGSRARRRVPPLRRGASRRRISASNTVTPHRSPSSSATSATIVTASTAASSAWSLRRVERRRPSSGPASSRHTTSRSCSMRYSLLIGRPTRAVAVPVDLAHVVVGEVVADRLELGAEPERAARAQARDRGSGRAAARSRAAARRRRRGTRAGRPPPRRRTCSARARAGPAPARGDRRQPARAAPVRDDRARRARPDADRRFDRDVGRLRLAELDARRRRRRRSRP